MKRIAKIALCAILLTFGFSSVSQAKSPVAGPQPVKVDLEAERQIQFDELLRQLGNKKIFDRTRSTALRPAAVIHPEDRDPVDIVLRRTAALLENLRLLDDAPDFAPESKQLKKFQKQAASVPVKNEKKRRALYDKACVLRRKIALANPLADFDKILFIKREINEWREDYGNHMCDQYFGFHATPGGGVFVLDGAFSDSPTLTNLTAAAKAQDGRFKGRALQGAFLSPDLSFDGQSILFAFTEAKNLRYKWTEETTYHIFKMNADGTGLSQLTDGPVNDFDPCFLPSGRVAFISERRGGYGRCHGRPVPSFTLHSMHDDGSDITMLSPHETNEWFPSVDNNGMIVYTRWDYVDRGHGQAHHPWITTPDGRDPRAIQGNYAAQWWGDRPNQEMSVRAIPNSRKYVATASGHHAQFYGSLVTIDPAIVDDDKMAMLRRVTPEQLFPESEFKTHQGEGKFATAWPLSEDHYLCVYDPRGNEGNRKTKWKDVKYGVYLIDSFGNRELLYRDPSFSCLEPIPFRARKKPPIIPHQTLVGLPPTLEGKKLTPTPKEDLPETGVVGLMNVYNTKLPFPEGTKIAALRIIQLLPKTTPRANNPRIGFGDQKGARAILGVIPVEEDGSAYFELPVGKPVYFQALNADGLAVQSMRSAAWVAPGERLTCNGCHEPLGTAPTPMRARPTAFLRPPSKIKPEVGGSKPFNFPRLVQPVLDKNCVDCHTKKIAEGKEKLPPDLRHKGDKPGQNGWSTSYTNLRNYAHFWDNASYTLPRTTPGKFGALTSKLYAMLQKGHNDVKLTDAEMRRLTLWLDSNSDFYGAYHDLADQAAGKIILPDLE